MAEHYHVIAWSTAIGNTPDTDVPPVLDEVIPIVNNHFFPGEPWDVDWVWAGSATLLRLFLRQPSYRPITDPYIVPFDRSATPISPSFVADYSTIPFRITPLEELELRATSGVATTERFTAVAGITRGGAIPAPRGQIFTLRGTSSSAAVANTWTTLANVVWNNTLAQGVYAVVGGVHQSPNAVAFRLILPEQQARPGALSITAVGAKGSELFRRGNLGEWGRFRTYQMPMVQVLATAADASHEIYLDLVKVG